MTSEALKQRLERCAQTPSPGFGENPYLVGGRPLSPPRGVKPKESEVLILLYPNPQGQWHIPLIKRSSGGGVHDHQMGLPGGKIEPLDTHKGAAAQREMMEELGVKSEAYRMIAALSPLYIPPSNFWVQAFVAISERPLEFVREVKEVASVHPMPLSKVFPEPEIGQRRLSLASGMSLNTKGFWLEQEWVWGATAIMLGEFSAWISAPDGSR